MPSLLDIAPPELVTRDIKIEAGTVTVQGITGETWCELYARYPALKTLVGGIGNIADLDRASATLATAAVLAAGTGHHDDMQHIRRATQLTSEDQQALLAEIIKISYPGEMFLPLASEEMRALLAGQPNGRDTRASDTTSWRLPSP